MQAASHCGHAADLACGRRRQIHGESEDDVPVPPLFRTALVWGLFMGLSSNVRYNIVFGLERLVDMTVAKQVPQVRTRSRHSSQAHRNRRVAMQARNRQKMHQGKPVMKLKQPIR